MSVAVVKVAPGQLGVVILAAAKRSYAAVRRGVKMGAQRGADYMASRNGPTPVDQGLLRNAWKAQHDETRGTSRVVNDAPYAGCVERGVRPGHMPPFEPILAWVKRHASSFGLRAPRKPRAWAQGPLRSAKAYASREAASRRYAEAVADFEDEVVSITQAVRWKIFQKGINPTFFVRSSLPRLVDFAGREVNDAVARSFAPSGGP